MEFVLLNFYKYVTLANPHALRDKFKDFMQKHAMRGNIYFATEGINASISGTNEASSEFETLLRSHAEFADVVIKKESVLQIPFNKVKVKVRNEICKFTHKVDLKNTGTHLAPKDLHNWYEKKEDFVIFDARNAYEYDIGHFRNAISANLEAFHEFPKAIELLKEKQDKKVVLYCTGGVRCEKATAYLKENGFNDVYQLDGGIITYLNQYKNENWDGRCFVFDKRLAQDEVNQNKPITKCIKCSGACDRYTNCEKEGCNKFMIMCEKCQKEMNDCCSAECKAIHEQELKQISQKEAVAVRKHY